MRTINRGWLVRQIKKGLVEVMCDYHYTDDYAFDNANKFGASADWLPAVWQEIGAPRAPDGVIAFDANDFDTSTGRAYEEKPGVIYLYVHSNLCYSVRVRAEEKPARKPRLAKAKVDAQESFLSFIGVA